MDTGEARQACSERAPPRNAQQRMHAGCDNSGKSFSNLAKEVNRNMFIRVRRGATTSERSCPTLEEAFLSVIGQLFPHTKTNCWPLWFQ